MGNYYTKLGTTLLCFNKQTFCLITGFLFGNEVPLPYNSPATLIPRLFGTSIHWREIKLSDLDKLFKESFNNLTDEDVVRVGLILVIDLVFLGRQKGLCPPTLGSAISRKL